MVLLNIPDMNRKLQEVSQVFTSTSKSFTSKIHQHEGRFRQQDFNDFESLLDDIKRDGLERIKRFFQERFQVRSNVYETEISRYVTSGDAVKNELSSFRENLVQLTLETKQQQNRKQQIMEHLSQRLRCLNIMKKAFKIWKDYQQRANIDKIQNARMDEIYKRNLKKKSFFPWRTLTYKDGYANSVSKQANKDIEHIQVQYQGIIDILKQKIKETDEIIKVKKAAKGQFAYALSKNLLKTISNLSLEVMNLNQMSLRDGEWSEEGTNRFMKEVDSVIKEKLTKVREYRQGLIDGEIGDEQGQKKRKHISFA